jgi:hypothetical protein
VNAGGLLAALVDERGTDERGCGFEGGGLDGGGDELDGVVVGVGVEVGVARLSSPLSVSGTSAETPTRPSTLSRSARCLAVDVDGVGVGDWPAMAAVEAPDGEDGRRVMRVATTAMTPANANAHRRPAAARAARAIRMSPPFRRRTRLYWLPCAADSGTFGTTHN